MLALEMVIGNSTHNNKTRMRTVHRHQNELDSNQAGEHNEEPIAAGNYVLGLPTNRALIYDVGEIPIGGMHSIQ